ncbi:MAG: hypothetical protein WC389_20995 [Lutibacter sp.]|jgi:hypothetical protein
MSGFKKISIGSVEIEHFSTSSLIKITFKHEVPDESGKTEEVVSEQWFSYSEFTDLRHACGSAKI